MPIQINEDSIVLESKAGSLTLYVTDSTVGLYLANEHGQLNLVSPTNMPPYICFYQIGRAHV